MISFQKEGEELLLVELIGYRYLYRSRNGFSPSVCKSDLQQTNFIFGQLCHLLISNDVEICESVTQNRSELI